MSDIRNKTFSFKSGLKLPNMVFPGPMDGVMSPLFCKTVEQLDLTDFWMTPFLRTTTGPVGKPKILRFTEHFSKEGKPVIVQLMGTDPEDLIETASRCRELGFAGVNFNLACPSKQVLSSRSGGALLKNHQFIKELMEASKVLGKDFSISLKIRIGFESPEEIAGIAKFAKSGNPDFVVIHHRTVSEGYDFAPNREERLSKAVKHFGDIPVIGNGDINSFNDAIKVMISTGCAGIMVARGWLKNPNLIRDIKTRKNSTEKEAKQSLAKFINTMAINSQENTGKACSEFNQRGDRNSIIDIASYIFERNHPFFEYIIHTPFKEPATELSFDRILSLI